MKIEEKRKKFLCSFLANLHSEVENKFSEGPNPFRNMEGVILDVMFSTLCVFLDTYLIPVCVDYINTERSAGRIPENSSSYDLLFSKNYTEILEIFEKNYSPVMSQMYNRCRIFKKHLLLACDRIFADWPEIKEKFGISDDDKIHRARFFCGDPHGDGPQTSIITFNNGEKGFVYKPVNLSIVQFFYDLLGYVEEKCEFSFKKIPSIIMKKSVGNGDYGYINFISYKGHVQNQAEAEKIYESFGKVLAFARFFKVADGHADNIVIHSPDVFWIDLENSFHFESKQLIQTDIHPLEVTGLIFEARKVTTMFGVITGIQGGSFPRFNLTQPIAINDGTDDMHVRYFSLSDVSEEDKKNRIYLNNEICMPEEYIESIQKYYRETIEKLLENKNHILSFMKKYLAKNEIVVRHIFKATASYFRYINLFSHVVSVKNRDGLYNIRNEINNLTEENEAFKPFIIENEITDLCNGVVPYFYRSNKSKSLYHISGVFKNNFFDEDLFSEFENHIQKFQYEDIENDIEFIKKSLESTRGLKNWDEFKKRFDYPEFDFKRAAESV